jgi:hypothetical protein
MPAKTYHISQFRRTTAHIAVLKSKLFGSVGNVSLLPYGVPNLEFSSVSQAHISCQLTSLQACPKDFPSVDHAVGCI